MTAPPDTAPAPRVALVVVHGVADQAPGATLRSLVDLLVAAGPQASAWRAVGSTETTLQVDPLAPRRTAAPRAAAGPAPPSLGRAFAPSLGRAFAQSLRSDFQRPAAGAAEAADPRRAASPSAPAGTDPGVALTDYLLAKYLANGAPREAFASSCIALERTAADGATQQVDAYEMYWADLSRLSGAIPRIVTEFFTMIFRLSKLGRETVDEARRRIAEGGTAPPSWRLLCGLQIALDWGFVNLLALQFAQLGLLVLALAPFALLGATALRFGGGATLLGLGLLWTLYRRRDGPAGWAAPAGLALAGAVALSSPLPAFWIAGAAWYGLITLGFAAALKVSEDRFPFTRFMGLLLWAGCGLLMLGFALARRGPGAPDPALWARAALFAIEAVLQSIEWWWVAAGVLLAAWLATGLLAARHGGLVGRASVATGRLGLFVSLTSFLVVTMALWTLVETPLEDLARPLAYATPAWFPQDEVERGRSNAELAADDCACVRRAAAAASVPAAAAGSTAQRFLRARYEDTTAYFALLAALLLMLAVYLVLVFLPSVLAELKWLAVRMRAGGSRRAARAAPVPRTRPADDAAAGRRLGRWLTAGYRHLDGAVLAIVALAIAVSVVVAVLLCRYAPGDWQALVPAQVRACVAWISREALRPFILGAAGLATALSALGGVLSRSVPSLRAPLDIALDVDNHFREFPRHSIPRARIFARYKALLEHVKAGGYDRIVVVSHSQGTVISAELLRYLTDGAAAEPAGGRRRRLRTMLGAELRLLTLGCPLRQLYAARFPALYEWVLAPGPVGHGPRADDLGVEVWANLFTSGDYVGRWLWSGGADAAAPLGDPMADSVRPPPLGRADAYAAFRPMPPHAAELDRLREFEMCLGLGAHTHYLEPDQREVALVIDQLVGSARRA